MTTYEVTAIRSTIQHATAELAAKREQATAYNQGCDASDAGQDEYACPFIVGTRPWFAWIKGWMAREVGRVAA